MEWSTGLDEDAAESSETLEERSMKKNGALSSLSSSSPSSSFEISFLYHHNTYMYYCLHVIVLSCFLRIYYLFLRDSKGESNKFFNSKRLFKSSSLPSITCPRQYYCQVSRTPVSQLSSIAVLNTCCTSTTLAAVNTTNQEKALPSFKSHLYYTDTKWVGGNFLHHQKPQELSSTEEVVAAKPAAATTQAPKSVSPKSQLADQTGVQLVETETRPIHQIACCCSRSVVCKHKRNIITNSTRHHFRKPQHSEGHHCMTTSRPSHSSTRGTIPESVSDTARKEAKERVISPVLSGGVTSTGSVQTVDLTSPTSPVINGDIGFAAGRFMRMCAVCLPSNSFQTIQLNTKTIDGNRLNSQFIGTIRMMVQHTSFLLFT